VTEARLIDVSAWATSKDELLSLDEIEVIERSGLGEVIHGEAPDHFRVRTSSLIGVVVGEGWELRVRPHLSVPRLMFLLGYARDEHGWKDLVAEFEEEDDLFTAIATAFSYHATWALDRGVLRGYVHRDERSISLRGRVRFGDQIARSGGLSLPVELSWDDFTEDVLENRMLRTAASVLLRLPRIPDATRRRLLRLRAILAEVTELPIGLHPEPPRITRLNDRYAAALTLAELVLRAASTGAEREETKGTTFVFDMNKVFEEFVSTALAESLRRRNHGGELREQVTDVRLSEKIGLKPDLVWQRNGQSAAVLDVKYKRLASESFPNADAFQMLAYALAYNLPEGRLIYAKMPGQDARVHAIASAGKRIVVDCINVALDPEDVLAQVDELSDRMANGVTDRLQAAA
jgi:5-methylcytosine-specific restriction enzyme subunit McrC